MDDADIKIKELRCSLVWVSLLKAGGKFETHQAYSDEFPKDESQNSNPDNQWTFPWRDQSGAGFWERYLEKSSLIDKPFVLNRAKATSCIIPLRLKKLRIIDLISKEKNINDEVLTTWIEGFAYPHGVVCVITLRWQSQIGLELKNAVDRMIELKTGVYQWSSESPELCPKHPETLDDLSLRIIKYLAHITDGEIQENDRTPFSTVTVIEAENAPLVGKPMEAGLLHRSLDALCTFSKKWESNRLRELSDQILLPTKENNPNDVLYAHERGRAVWLPFYFRENWAPSKYKPIRYSGRYHRNLTLATMQTAYLSLFLRWMDTNSSKNSYLIDWERSAVAAIGRLYGKCRKSYMSSSLPAQIKPFEEQINSVRGKRKFKPLGYEHNNNGRQDNSELCE